VAQAAPIPATKGATIAGSRTFETIRPAVNGAKAGAHNHCADQTTEESVRRAGWQAEEPGHQVPDDRAQQSSQDDRNRDQRIVEEAARDRLGNLGRQARADDIEDGGKNYCGAGPKGSGCDRPGHGIGAVVEAIREIEDQSYDNDSDHDEQLCHISFPSRIGWFGRR